MQLLKLHVVKVATVLLVLKVATASANPLDERNLLSASFDPATGQLSVHCLSLEGYLQSETPAVKFNSLLSQDSFILDFDSLISLPAIPPDCEDHANVVVDEQGDIVEVTYEVKAANILGTSDVYNVVLRSEAKDISTQTVLEVRKVFDNVPDLVIPMGPGRFQINLPSTYDQTTTVLESSSGESIAGLDLFFGFAFLVDTGTFTESQELILKGTTVYGVEFIERFRFQIAPVDCATDQMLVDFVCTDIF